MIGRLFWFAVGIGVAAFVYKKVRGYMKASTPEAIGHRVAESASGIGTRAQDFASRVRSGMAEREAELREALDMPE